MCQRQEWIRDSVNEPLNTGKNSLWVGSNRSILEIEIVPVRAIASRRRAGINPDTPRGEPSSGDPVARTLSF